MAADSDAEARPPVSASYSADVRPPSDAPASDQAHRRDLARAAKEAGDAVLAELERIGDDGLSPAQHQHLTLARDRVVELLCQVEVILAMNVVSQPSADGPASPRSPTQDAGAPQTAAVAAAAESAPAIRALLVEDNQVNRQIAQTMLEQIGVEVAVAVDGQQALAALDRASFELVLMDLGMPVMDGLEATRRLRRREALGGLVRTPVIALTADTTATDRQACFNAGMDDFLSKPFSRAGLRQVVEHWVRPCRQDTN